MRAIFKYILVAVFTFGLINIPMNVNATEKIIEINKSNKFSENSSKVLIESTGILPGDTIKEKITIKNSSNNIFNIKLQLDDLIENNELSNRIKLNINYKSKHLFNGYIDDLNGQTVDLGIYNPSEKEDLFIQATLDGSNVGNELQNKQLEFKLAFSIIGDDANIDNSLEGGNDDKNGDGHVPKTGLPYKITTFLIAFILIGFGVKLIKKK